MLNLECLPRIRIDCEYTGVLRSSESPNPNPKTLSFAFTRKLFGNSPSEALQLLSSGQPFAGPTTIVEAAMATPGPSSSEEPPLRLPSPDEIRAQDIFNNCAVRTAVSGVMGGGMGIFMGMLFGALETPVHAETMTARQNFVHAARTMSTKSVQMAKTFSVMGAIFAGTECVFEKARARHDSTNTVLAGCATGGSMSARAGPQAACLGCAGFAAFSVVIEKIFDRHN